MFSGVTRYTTRPVPNGPDIPVTFNWDPNFGFPAEVWDHNMSSVSAEMDIGGGGQGGKFSLTVVLSIVKEVSKADSFGGAKSGCARTSMCAV